MTWENVVAIRLTPTPPAAVSVGTALTKSKEHRGHPRITFNFNKAMVYKCNLKAQNRAELEVGRGEHEGFVRITFDKPNGNCRVIDGGGAGAGKQGCRVSSAIWPELKPVVKRVKITEDCVHWDAEKRIMTIAIPPQFFLVQKHQNDLRSVLSGT